MTSTTKTNEPTKEYIGDGVYVTFKDGALTLETERWLNIHRIVLDHQVYAALVAYVSRLRKEDR